MDRVEQELKGRTALLSAGGDQCPNPLAPTAAGLASRSLGDPPVDDHEANRLFRKIVGGVDPWGGDEAEVRLPVFVEAIRHISGVFGVRHAGRGCLQYCSRAASNAF